MSLYKGNNLISGHQVLYSTTGNNTDGAMTQDATTNALDGKVSKSGDTMTGDLTILKDNGFIIEKTSFDSTTTTAPSEYSNLGTFAISDTNNNLTGYIQNYFDAGNLIGTQIGARRIINGENITASLYLNVNASGNTSCTFPNTTCCDGEWVSAGSVTIVSDLSLNGSSRADYTLNSLPDDGHYYEVVVSAELTSTATSGQFSNVLIGSNASDYARVCSVVPRSNASVRAAGSVTLPINPNRKLYINRTTNNYGTVKVTLQAYRRIGTNS